jgi:hypothetical protein
MRARVPFSGCSTDRAYYTGTASASKSEKDTNHGLAPYLPTRTARAAIASMSPGATSRT